MAIGAITFVRKMRPRNGIRERIISMVGAASYTTGGDAITAANLQLAAIDAIFFELPNPLADLAFIFDKTNLKIMAIVLSTGLQVAAATNLSTSTVRAHVVGR